MIQYPALFPKKDVDMYKLRQDLSPMRQIRYIIARAEVIAQFKPNTVLKTALDAFRAYIFHPSKANADKLTRSTFAAVSIIPENALTFHAANMYLESAYDEYEKHFPKILIHEDTFKIVINCASAIECVAEALYPSNDNRDSIKHAICKWLFYEQQVYVYLKTRFPIQKEIKIADILL